LSALSFNANAGTRWDHPAATPLATAQFAAGFGQIVSTR